MRGFRELDGILRGSAAPAPGTRFVVPLGPVVVVNVILAACYGVCMGFFGVFGRSEPDFRFLLADALKVPLLFLLTLVVTFPSLYVFGALVGSRLGALDLARLLAAALGVLVAVLAAFGPIVAFFSVTTTSYPFILLLNVGVFTLAAGFAIAFLLRTVDRLTTPVPPSPAPALADVVAESGGEAAGGPEPAPDAPTGTTRPADPDEGERPGRRERVLRRRYAGLVARHPRHRVVMWAWLGAYAFVGIQMGWVLRPFIGQPGAAVTFFREDTWGNAYVKLVEILWRAVR